MIVEPVPTSPRSPIRRLAGALGLVLPVALFAVVLAAGLLGRVEDVVRAIPDPTPAPRETRPAGPTPASSPQSPEQVARVADRASFPRAIDDLPVRDVTTTLALRARGTTVGVVAVSGYLSLPAIPAACTDRILGPAGALCERDGVVADRRTTPWTRSGVAWTELGPHLHPLLPPGVRLPSDVARTTIDDDGPPLPVVLLGRFDDPRATPCPPTDRECRDAFVVSGVAWFDGDMWRRPTVLEPTLDFDVNDDPWPDQRTAAREALGDVDRVLIIALVGPATLRTIDPAAADALPDSPAARLWYVLGLEVLSGRGGGEAIGRTRWVVVDNTSGEVVAAGGDPAGPGGDGAPPDGAGDPATG